MSKNRNISVKFLIHLVGERPALWDKTSNDYKDRALKETSWREICTFVNENYENMQPKAKAEFTRMISRKWTHIRDSWVKSMKYGYDEVTKAPPKPYIYHNELHFMQKILKCQPPRYDLNRSQISNKSFEEFYRDQNETKSGNDCNGAETNEYEDYEANVDIVDENLKQENDFSIQDHEDEPNNHGGEHDDEEDDWPLEDTEITPIIESEDNKTSVVKKKRTSIFRSARDKEEEYKKPRIGHTKSVKYEQPVEYDPQNEYEKTTGNPEEFGKRPSSSVSAINGYKYFYENRHWNFFKGILPSVDSLDEDHILQFQSGVIVMLQNLRESQQTKPHSNRVSSHSLFRGRGRKRRTSNDDDYYWPTHNVNVEDRPRRSQRQHRTDPIAPEQSESENSEN